MKYRGSVFFSLLALVLVLGATAFNPFVNNAEKEAILMHTILGGINQLHYSPKQLDDEFSQKVFNLYMDRLDGGRRWLTQSDVNQLKAFENKIDDEADAGTYELFNLSIDLIQDGIDKTQKYYQEILAEPFDFTKHENIDLDNEKKAFASDDKELYEYWRQSLKYETLVRLNNKMEAQEEGLEEGEEKKTYEELEKEARESVLETFNDWYKRLGKRKRADLLSSYLNAVTNVFDPHSGYYQPKDKENFDIGMSGTLEGIGARLQTDGDYTKVVMIVPGGPAWKQKDLEENDLITSVKQEDEEDAVDVTGFVIDDVVKLIRGKKGTKVTLRVKKVDGSFQNIVIKRDVVIMEESYARSVILDLPDVAENIGYIKLPRFYADFSGRGGPSCAKDIHVEINKLKNEKVNGIVLDLRNNGGGSLRDVVEMSGLFIEEGPIVQVKSRGRDPQVLKDTDPKVQYDGPLIVMVNSFSASASEILAAALQDYKRAIIVGSKATYGKGTVQRFFDLDRAISGNSEIKPLGEVKLTIQKFYRVNGGSTQMKGVTPDIILPDRFHYMKAGEEEYDYAMEWTEIPSVEYSQKVTNLDRLEDIKAASEKRVAKNENFNKVLEQAKWLKDRSEESNYSLNFEDFKMSMIERDKEADEFDDMWGEIEGLSVSNLDADLARINANESKQVRNEDWIKGIKKDIYINEVLNIMSDMKN